MIYENFISKETQKNIESLVFSQEFGWFFSGKTISLYQDIDKNIYKTKNAIMDETMSDPDHFTHLLYFNGERTSNFFYEAKNIFDSFCLNQNILPKAIIRAKFNFFSKSSENIITPAHVDLDYDHKVFIYYVNDSDGDTIIYNEKFGEKFDKLSVLEKIPPRRGTAAFFDGLHYHSASTPVKSRNRVVLNIAFI